MNTPLNESNLAHIGSKEDRSAKHAAAEIEANWDGVGERLGLKIWRVENTHENGVAKFGINPWPEKMYGQFFTGDSYIVLSTTQDDESESFLFDIFFWIGSESTQDEYGVVAYKTCELDDLLDDAAIQHREVQYHESSQFLDLFMTEGAKIISYIDGGISGGFRSTADTEDDKTIPHRLFHIRRTNRHTRSVQVPLKCSSLNQGDAFVLDAGQVIYTWFGTLASGFEKSQAGALSHNLANTEGRQVTRQESDVDDDHEEFWNLLGGKEEIMEADDSRVADIPLVQEPVMFKVNDDANELSIDSIPFDKESLCSDDAFLIDIGATVFVWLGRGSTKREKQEAMRMAQTYFRNLQKGETTNVIRVMEGQEKRVPGWPV